jgi:hypothetical protein
MTGGFGLPLDTERALSDDVRWTGVAAVKGPSWARMSLLTVTMLGLQIVWSVEMGYGALLTSVFHIIQELSCIYNVCLQHRRTSYPWGCRNP